MSHVVESIPDGRAGLMAKVQRIRRLVEDAKRDPMVRQRAAAIVRDVPQRDQVGEVRAVWQWVRDHVRYLRDPDGVELFTTPRRLLEDVDRGVAAEDCDGHVILASALIESIGYPTRYRIGGMPPDKFRHIWLQARAGVPPQWLTLELTKKEEPFEYDPSGRFPLTLTLDGSTMLSTGLGATAPAPRVTKRVDPQRQAMVADRARMIASGATRQQVARRQAVLASQSRSTAAAIARTSGFEKMPETAAGALSRWDQWDQKTRDRMNRKVGLGAPPDWQTPQERRWLEQATTDVWSDEAMLGDLGGVFSKLRKLKKKVREKVKKTAKRVVKTKLKVARKLFDPREHLRALKKVASYGKAPKAAAAPADTTTTYEAPTTTDPGSQMMQPLPFQTGLAPAPLFDVAQGSAMAPDPWAGWDAQTEDQEVASLYTPSMQQDIGPDEPMPGEGEGSYIPTPDWPGTEDAYDEPADRGGEDYPPMDYEQQEEAFGDNSHPMLGDWLTDLAQQVVAPAAQTFISYQQARLSAQAAKKGYGPLQFGAQPTQAQPTITTPAPAAPPVVVQVPAPPSSEPGERRRPPSTMAKYGPIIMVGVGAIVLVALMGGVRRR